MTEFTVTGGAELARMLETLPSRVSRRIQREALTDAGSLLARRMAIRAPHEPGKPDLRDTMTVSGSRGIDAHETAVVVGPTREGFYGSFLEFGTARISARPWMRPAFDESVQDILTLERDAIWLSLVGRGISRSLVRDVPVQAGPGGGLL